MFDISALKIGDEVAIESRFSYDKGAYQSTYRLAIVTCVTATRITVKFSKFSRVFSRTTGLEVVTMHYESNRKDALADPSCARAVVAKLRGRYKTNILPKDPKR